MLASSSTLQIHQTKECSGDHYTAVQEYMNNRASTEELGKTNCPLNTPRISGKTPSEILIVEHESPMHINLPRSRDPQDSPKQTKVLRTEYVKLPSIKKKKVAVGPFMTGRNSNRSRRTIRSQSSAKSRAMKAVKRAISNSSI